MNSRYLQKQSSTFKQSQRLRVFYKSEFLFAIDFCAVPNGAQNERKVHMNLLSFFSHLKEEKLFII